MNNEEKLCQIRDLQHAIALFETNFEKAHGICLNDGMTLCSLQKAEKLSSGELSAMLGLSHSNMSKVLKSVEKKGYVKRDIGDNDKRQMFFLLTDTGRQLLADIKNSNHQMPEPLGSIIK